MSARTVRWHNNFCDTMLMNERLVQRLERLKIPQDWTSRRGQLVPVILLDDLFAYCKRQGWSVAARNGIDGGWCASVGGNTIHYAEGRTLVRALALAVLDATGKEKP